MTDATTRLLETPERPRVGFDTVGDAQPLVPRTDTQSIAGSSTRALEPSRPQQKWMITSVVLIVLLVIVTAVLLINNSRTTRTVVIPPNVTRPVIPPPVPPLLPGTGAGEGGVNIDPSLVYPGSQTTMTVNEGDGKAVTQLHTSDAVGKVSDWYMNRLKPTNIVRRPEATIFEAGTLKVIINSTGNGTDIFLTEGED